jgi:hypothetical protein
VGTPSGIGKRCRFCVRRTRAPMKSTPDYATVFDQDTTDGRIRCRMAEPPPGQLDGLGHPIFIS